MKRLGILLAAVFLATACFMVAGCGGGNNAGADVVGTWELSGGQGSDGTTYGPDEIALMKSMGMDVTFTFSEDGTAIGTLSGDETKGTWKSVDASTIDITINGQTQQGVLKNGELSITVNGETLTFSKAKS